MPTEIQMNESDSQLISAETAAAREANQNLSTDDGALTQDTSQENLEAQPAKEAEVEGPKSFGGYKDRARDDMVARFRERRNKDEAAIRAAETGQEQPEEETLEGVLEDQRQTRRNQENLEDWRSKKAQEQPRAGDGKFAAQDATVRLKLLGEEIDFTRSEVVQASGFSEEEVKHLRWEIVQETAQKRLAAEVYLRRSRDQSKQPPAAQPQPQQPPAQQQQPQPAQEQDADADEAKLQEALIYGSPEEAQAAIRDFSAKITRKAGAEAARQAVAQVQHQQRWDDVGREVQSEWAAINREHPQLQQGPFASTMRDHAVNVTRATIIDTISRMPDHVRAAFEQRGLTPDRIMAIGDDGHVARLYRDMAAKGYPVAPPKAVLREAANRAIQDVQKVTGRPAQGTPPQPAPSVQVDRQARREAISTIPPKATQPAPAAPKRKSVSDVINEMRRAQPQRQ